MIKSVLEPVLAVGDFQPLFDRLADDVVLEVTVSGEPPGREVRGKREVMAFFLNGGAVAVLEQHGTVEYSGTADRVVVQGVGTFDRKASDVAVRGRESAAVVDLHDGRIIRFLVVRNAAPTLVTTLKRGR